MAASTHSADQIRLLIVEDVEQVAQYVRSLISSQTQVKLLDVISDGRSVVEQIHELRPDMLIVDVLLRGKVGGLEVIDRVRQADIHLPIIALTVPQTTVKLRPEMGIVRVLSMPFSGYEFMHLIQEAYGEYRAQAPDSLSRIFTVFGAKGGVGVTTIAFNLAAAIARATSARVALLDGSLQFADLRALVRAPENAPSVLDLPTDSVQKKDLADIIWRDQSGVDIVLAPSRVEMSEMVTARDMEKLLSLLRRVYNVVIIDTASTVNDILLAFFDHSD
ncbi:MAG: response regulator, partial [Chloroflexota bacterium]|nr:response regulator [Chloroflexota bacterium]